jgi:hypothetical protein
MDLLTRKATPIMIIVATQENATYDGIPIAIIMLTGKIIGASCMDYLIKRESDHNDNPAFSLMSTCIF